MYTFLIKPTNNCNLRCKYCFISNAIKSSSEMMTIDIAKLAIKQIAEFLGEKNETACKILWHGGEPLFWDSAKFDEILTYMNAQYPKIAWHNSIQTNLTLLTEDHIKVFKVHKMGISTSMDGYEQLHNQTRVMHNGEGSFQLFMNKLQLLRDNSIPVGIIVVLTSKNINKVIDIYEFYKSIKQSFRINPLLDAGEAIVNNHLSITPKQYSEAMITLFDYWFKDKDAIPISNFIDWTSALVTRLCDICVASNNCQTIFTVIEPNGDISACDRLTSQKEFVFGNVKNDNLLKVFSNKKQIFENRTEQLKNGECIDCKYWDICYGGCPSEGQTIMNKTRYCQSYIDIFSHIEKIIKSNKLINY